MLKSSVGSAGVDDGHYPVDDIKDQKCCELIFKMNNLSIKVADSFALTNPPGALHRYNLIPPGYARVGVDEVVTEYQELNIDFPGGEGQQTLREAKQSGIYLWRKQWIIFQTLCQVQRVRHLVHHHPQRWSASRLRSTSRVLHPSPRWSAVRLRNISRVLHHPSPRWITVGLIRCDVSRVLHHPSPRWTTVGLIRCDVSRV